MKAGNVVKGCLLQWSALLISLCTLMGWQSGAFAEEGLCARVKIEIRQELTLERQAFDAHMVINNGLSDIPLENVAVEVSFADEDGNPVLAVSDPDNTLALFFIRVDAMENITDVNGAGVVDPSTSADIHWLIIPAPGASNGLESGTLYYVGARLSYTIGGEGHVTEVTPDYIQVKPMPELLLDYFLPLDVIGDDAFTDEIEPPIPFSLGVRVRNNGFGTARKLKIESAQPEIVDNEQGLLINFVIEESQVNDEPAEKSLLLDFGDLAPDRAVTGRWIMICTLSGQFIEFDAEFTHSDDLGGVLTSLIEDVETHTLVRDVLVDLPGRDGVLDFLARDGSVYRVYESDNLDTEVLDQSAYSDLQLTEQQGADAHHTLTTAVTAGFLYVQLPDPYDGRKILKEAIRSDGKVIRPENAWLSQTRSHGSEWDYHVNLFDANTTDTYTLVFTDPEQGPQAPVMQYIPDRSRSVGQQLSFIVEASDPNGTIPMLSAAPLPAGALFQDQGDGVGIFDWTPDSGQSGRYELDFIASDGTLEDTEHVVLTIFSGEDTDGDGMPDEWELSVFGTLDRDGTGDYDGDGISDLDEFLSGTDPTVGNRVPSVPEVISPLVGGQVAATVPELLIRNSVDLDGNAIEYEFELYSDPAFTDRVAYEHHVPETPSETSWQPPTTLTDNAYYYWRVRASDGASKTLWAYGRFFVNTENDPPGALVVSDPPDGAEVDTLRPLLQVTTGEDPDGDAVVCGFYVYADAAMTMEAASVEGIAATGDGTVSCRTPVLLEPDTQYTWKAVCMDPGGASAESAPSSFVTALGNAAPTPPVISYPVAGSEIATREDGLCALNATDADGDALTYEFELDEKESFNSEAGQASGPMPESEEATCWHVSDLKDNTLYHWRVRANDGTACSHWSVGQFFVNLQNDPPDAPVVKNPGSLAWTETLTPALELHPAPDADGDALSYELELYGSAGSFDFLARSESAYGVWVMDPPLDDATWYYWRARAVDEHGAASDWGDETAFFVKDNGVDDPPEQRGHRPLL
ncbi:MAG: hypothetical protein JRF65_09690 [Deltaproteobacteria bacterium]|nr:hypothetical protein [Deltaproteobacteria bacterium]